MKIQNVEMEFVAFDAQDVIETSDGSVTMSYLASSTGNIALKVTGGKSYNYGGEELYTPVSDTTLTGTMDTRAYLSSIYAISGSTMAIAIGGMTAKLPKTTDDGRDIKYNPIYTGADNPDFDELDEVLAFLSKGSVQ